MPPPREAIMSLFRELVVASAELLWPVLGDSHGRPAERVLVFECAGGRPLTLASNCPYELWLDGRFVGDGGHRVSRGKPWPTTGRRRPRRLSSRSASTGSTPSNPPCCTAASSTTPFWLTGSWAIPGRVGSMTPSALRP